MKTIHECFHECTNDGSQFEYSWFSSWTVDQREFNQAMIRNLLSALAGMAVRAHKLPSQILKYAVAASLPERVWG